MKKTMRSFSLLLLWGLSVIPMLAQQVSVEEAMLSAKKFLRGSSSARARAKANVPLSLSYTSEQAGKKHFYVFNSDAVDGGFIIVGGDEAAREILGYSESGAFDYDKAPDNLKWWLSQYDAQIAEGIRQGVNSRTEGVKHRRVPRAHIEPLIKTKWHQNHPFNKAIPKVYSDPFVTGCVATAMAQVMKFHQWPAATKSKGSKVHTLKYDGVDHVFSADFGNTTYDWANMLNEYSGGSYTDEQANAVAVLSYHAGVSVEMNYGTGASGASPAKISKALIDYFGYDKSMQYLQRTYYTDVEWEDIVYNELSEGRPVLYGGQSPGGGHEFICDGYNAANSDYFFNWGWGGYCDGHYAITGVYALKPNGSGTGGAGDDAAYINGQDIVIGVKPDAGGSYVYNMNWTNFPEYGAYIGLSTTAIKKGGTFFLDGAVHNISATAIHKLQIGVRLTDGVNNYEKIIYDFPDYNLESGFLRTITNYEISLSGMDIPAGTYTVQILYRPDEHSEWTVAKIPTYTAYPQIRVTETDPYTVTKTTCGNGEYATADNVSLKLSVRNNTDEDFSTTFDYALITVLDPKIAGYFIRKVELPANTETEIVIPCSSSDPLENGKYYVEKGNGTNSYTLTGTQYLDIVSKKNIEYNLLASGWGTLILPYDAEIPGDWKVYSCASIDGTTLNLIEQSEIKQFTPYIVQGTPMAHTFSGPDVPSNSTYTVGLLTGTMEADYMLKANDYILQKQGDITAFYKVGDGPKLNQPSAQYRCFLNLGGGLVAAVMMPSDDGTTGIEQIAGEAQPAVSGIYSVNGVKQNSLQKGINIIRMSDGRTVKVIK